MKNWLVNNFWIKILSLILAVITWFYVNGELSKEGRVSSEIYKVQPAEYPEEKSSSEEKSMNKGYIMEKK